jgi:hypothetical protein
MPYPYRISRHFFPRIGSAREHLEQLFQTGVMIGKSNRRGVTTRVMGAGGDQERELARQYREWSQAAAFDWPRTSGILENLAKNYDHQAKAHDEDAERLDWR